MGAKDKKQNFIMEDPKYFADFINACAYQGAQILKKENISDKKQVYTVLDDDKAASWSVIRDVIMKTELNDKQDTVVVLIGLENQSEIHYAMPLKILKSDVANYIEQLKRIAESHDKNRDLKTGAEFLSGFAKSDKLIPVLTYCIYWGEEEWNGPRCLKEMLDISGIPEEINRLINDYSVNLIEVNKFEHPEYFQTDLRVVFEFLKNRRDSHSMRNYIKEHETELEHISEGAFDLICEVSKFKGLKDMKNKFRNGKGEIEMCKAVEEWSRMERDVGKLEGRIEGVVFYLDKKGTTKENIAKECEITVKEVEDILAETVV